MFEKTPDFFKQFQKKLVYFTNDSIPDFLQEFTSYAYGFHNDSSKEYCSLNNSNHYHFMVDISSAPTKEFPLPVHAIPCVYSTFKYLIASANKRIFQGDLFAKLQSAVLYNAKTQQDKTSVTVLRKRLPQTALSCKSNGKEAKFIEKPTKSVGVQTDQLHTVTLQRFQNLLAGPRCAEFLMIMDIIGSGYGSLTTNSTNNCVNFSLNTNN